MNKYGLYTGLGITGLFATLFGVPLVPCYLVWLLVSPASDAIALLTVFLCAVIYVFAWLIILFIIIIIAAIMD